MRALQNKHLYVLILLLVGSRVFMYMFLSYTMDDAFITYRYAQNIARGDGFVYNSGERVQGTSTPLYTLILAGCASLIGTENIPVASRVISLIADVISLVILWTILSALSDIGGFITCVLFAMYPKIVLVSVSGMETSFVVMLMMLSYLLLFVVNRRMAAFLAFGLLLLCRFDGIIWVAVCLWKLGWTNVKVSFRGVLLCVAIIAAWLIFSEVYFGSIIPHSVVAKRVSFSHEYSVFDPVRVLGGYFPFEGFRDQSSIVRTTAVVFLLLPVIAHLIKASRTGSVLWIFPMFFLVYNLLFSLGRTIMADWYYVPGYISLFVSIGSLLGSFAASENGLKHVKLLRNTLMPGTALALAVLLFLGAARWEKSIVRRHLSENIPIGAWLAVHGGERVQVLVEPIGYIGWISGSYIHDYIGLVSPPVIDARRRHLASDSWFIDYVREKHPDFIVLRDWEIPTNRLFMGYGDGIFKGDADRSWFAMNYEQVDLNPDNPQHETDYLILYEKVERATIDRRK